MQKRYLLALILTVALAGCKSRLASAPAPTATPTPKPTPTPVYGQLGRLKAKLTSPKGVTLATLEADGANYDPLHPDETITVRNGNAVLYEDGKPSTRVRAETLTVDRVKRQLTAIGNARANSLDRKDAPTVRADRMTWDADRKILTGKGNVLATTEPDFVAPGTAFSADTKLNALHVQLDERPVTGSL